MSRTGVHLEFHHMVKFQTDTCLECNVIIAINFNELIPHFSTNFARRHLSLVFGMGYAARVCSMVLWRSIASLSGSEFPGNVISGERYIRGPCGLLRREPPQSRDTGSRLHLKWI